MSYNLVLITAYYYIIIMIKKKNRKHNIPYNLLPNESLSALQLTIRTMFVKIFREAYRFNDSDRLTVVGSISRLF